MSTCGVNILKIPREVAVPMKVLVKMNLTLDCSVIKVIIGNRFDKIVAQFEKAVLSCDLEKRSSFCCTRFCSILCRKISSEDCVDEDY